MHQHLLHSSTRARSLAPGGGESLHRAGVARRHRARRFGFDEPQIAALARHNEIHLQPLLVAKVVQLAPPARIQLSLHDFASDEALEQRAQERRLLQLRLRLDAQQMTGNAGIGDIDFRRLDEALAEVFEIRSFPERRGPVSTSAGKLRTAAATRDSSSLRR